MGKTVDISSRVHDYFNSCYLYLLLGWMEVTFPKINLTQSQVQYCRFRLWLMKGIGHAISQPTGVSGELILVWGQRQVSNQLFCYFIYQATEWKQPNRNMHQEFAQREMISHHVTLVPAVAVDTRYLSAKPTSFLSLDFIYSLYIFAFPYHKSKHWIKIKSIRSLLRSWLTWSPNAWRKM